MQRITVDLIAGARPNFMKVAPLYKTLISENWCIPRLIHTGQHYDAGMSGVFLKELGLPEPDIHLGVGGTSHAEQTARVMLAYEKVCQERPANWAIVVGDINSTMACTITARKLRIPVAHLESGLRSRDRFMPEEINRIVTDSLSDLLWTPSSDADANLLGEGVPEQRICRIGNIMIDSFEMLRPTIEERNARLHFGQNIKGYGVVTLHRPSNVDDKSSLSDLVKMITDISKEISLVFPVHPRTRERLRSFGLLEKLTLIKGVTLTEPLGYVDFMSLVLDSLFVITDSGGVQEETTYLNIPCLTLRESTERPITVTQGSNRLVNLSEVAQRVEDVLNRRWPQASRIEFWDGKAASRAVQSLASVASI